MGHMTITDHNKDRESIPWMILGQNNAKNYVWKQQLTIRKIEISHILKSGRGQILGHMSVWDQN